MTEIKDKAITVWGQIEVVTPIVDLTRVCYGADIAKGTECFVVASRRSCCGGRILTIQAVRTDDKYLGRHVVTAWHWDNAIVGDHLVEFVRYEARAASR